MQNKNYGKFEFGKFAYAPNPLWINNNSKMIANPTQAQYIENGYKKIIYVDEPTYGLESGHYYVPTFHELNEYIVQVWKEFILPSDTIIDNDDDNIEN